MPSAWGVLRTALLFAGSLGSSCYAIAAQEAIKSERAGDQEARVSGRVLSLSTKQPLKNATLRLRPPFPSASTPPNVDDAAYTTHTDASGRFVFQDVDPGSYWLTAERQGYLRQEYGAPGPGRLGTVLNIEAGQTLKDLAVTLMPQCTIAGRVVDEDGEPVGTARVTASAVRYVNGARRLFPVSFGEANANGGFLLGNLPPGHYYLSAEKTGPVLVGGTSETTRSTSKEAYVRTYYPNTAEPSAAAPVSMTPGAAVGGADIRMQKAGVYRIRGNAEFPAELAPGARRLLVLTPRSAFDLANITGRRMAALRADGSFEFEEVVPGDYILQPERMRLGGVVAGQMEVTVTDRDLEGVSLILSRAPEISGQVRFEAGTAHEAIQAQPASVPVATATPKAASTARSGVEILPPPPPAQLALARSQDEPKAASPGETAPPPPAEREQKQVQPGALAGTASQAPTEGAVSGVHVSLSAAEGVSINAPRATSTADGTFRITNVQTGPYRAKVSQLPPGTYAKSVLYNGQDATDSIVDVTAGGGTLEVVLAAKAGEITGVVRDDREKPAPNVFVSAWIASEPKPEAADRTQTTATDANGTFRFGNLPPGEYRVAAWEDIDSGLAQYRPFCELFGSKAAKVQLGENGRERVDVKLVPAAAIASATARLP